MERDRLVEELRAGGFVAADEEADALELAAAGEPAILRSLLSRRLAGEPLAWVLGWATFCGLRLAVHPGVYPPRPHTEALARHARAQLPAAGVAIDVCTGCGAIAAVLARAQPGARVVATDVDPAAVACARANGVDALAGDLLGPLPHALHGGVDVVTAVVPYVPTNSLRLLPRDTFRFETALAYDGGPDGTALQRRVIAEATAFLRPGGTLALEMGGDQAAPLGDCLRGAGYVAIAVLADSEGDPRAIHAVYQP